LSDQSPQGDERKPSRIAGRASLVSISEAATLLGVSRMTVNRRIRSRSWPSGRVGRKHLLPLAFVEGAIAAIESGSGVDIDAFAATWLANSEAVA
jgi:excisionase family DNA binding protein